LAGGTAPGGGAAAVDVGGATTAMAEAVINRILTRKRSCKLDAGMLSASSHWNILRDRYPKVAAAGLAPVSAADVAGDAFPGPGAPSLPLPTPMSSDMPARSQSTRGTPATIMATFPLVHPAVSRRKTLTRSRSDGHPKLDWQQAVHLSTAAAGAASAAVIEVPRLASGSGGCGGGAPPPLPLESPSNAMLRAMQARKAMRESGSGIAPASTFHRQTKTVEDLMDKPSQT